MMYDSANEKAFDYYNNLNNKNNVFRLAWFFMFSQARTGRKEGQK